MLTGWSARADPATAAAARFGHGEPRGRASERSALGIYASRSGFRRVAPIRLAAGGELRDDVVHVGQCRARRLDEPDLPAGRRAATAFSPGSVAGNIDSTAAMTTGNPGEPSFGAFSNAGAIDVAQGATFSLFAPAGTATHPQLRLCRRHADPRQRQPGDRDLSAAGLAGRRALACPHRRECRHGRRRRVLPSPKRCRASPPAPASLHPMARYGWRICRSVSR